MRKKKHSVGYFSAYYRGAEMLVDLWPKIRAEVPDATLDIAYGWQSWVNAEGEDEFYHRMNDKFAAVKKMGVKVHDRLSHKDLAKLMNRTAVWAYPTEFSEIFCITAVKANAAHMKPVITDVAALQETGGPVADFVEAARIYSDEYAQDEFVAKVVKALKEPLTEKEIKQQDKFVKQFQWSEVAKEWGYAIKG